MGKKKKLLMILNYFHPEYASTGQLMTDLAKYLQNDFNITVIANVPSYSGEIDKMYTGSRFYYDTLENIKIIRVSVPKVDKRSKISRIKYILTYSLNAFLAIFKAEKPDIIYTISQPPILGGLLGRLGKLFRGGKLVYNIQDFNPEQSEAVGYNKLPLVNSVARWLDNRTCISSDAIVVVGRDMKQTLLNRSNRIKEDKSFVVNNWTNEKQIIPLTKGNPKVNNFLEEHGLKDKFVIMYSGNIGLFYDLENIIKVIGLFRNYEYMRFLFVGEGAKKEELIDYCTDNKIDNVIFLPYQPKEELVYSLNSADVHLVTNQKGIKGVSVPSKMYGIMAAGKPVLGILEEGSEVQLLISKSSCGKSVEPKDYSGIKEMIDWFYNNSNKISDMGFEGKKYLDNNLRMEISLNKYKKILTDICIESIKSEKGLKKSNV